MTLALWVLSDAPFRDEGSASASRGGTPSGTRSPHDRAAEQAPNTQSSATDDTDRALVRRVAEGSSEALGEIFADHYDALYRTTYRVVHSREVAEELVQELFLTLWRDRATWILHTTLAAYLHTAARNRAVQWLRREMVERRFADRAIALDDSPAMSAFSASSHGPDAAERGDLDDLLRHAVDQLPERVRFAVILRWRHDLRNAEVAAIMGVTVKAVEANLARGVNHLRTTLAALGLTGLEG